MDMARLRQWKQLIVVVTLLAYILSKEYVTAQYQQASSDNADEKKQVEDTPEFMPKFLQQGQWAKAFSKRQSSSASGVKNVKSGGASKRAFGSSSSSSFAKTSRKTSGGGIKNSKTSSNIPEVGSQVEFAGGCVNRPHAPKNAALQCSAFSGCRASCFTGHTFPNGEKQLFITCNDAEWQVENAEWETIPDCEPICIPACQHNGICVKPNECNCPENYAGPQCQFERKPCLNYPPVPENSRRSCTSKTCTILCLPGHEFPDGSAAANMLCREGVWVPSRSELKSIPDCQPVCKPPCQNGGKCLSFNTCQCPDELRGPQCQYAASACSPQKLEFNGGHKCSFTSTTYKCTVSCPPPAHFKESPASEYVCEYATGKFHPSPVPECVFDPDVEVIPNSILSQLHLIGAGSNQTISTLDLSNSSDLSQILGNAFLNTLNSISPLPEISVIENLPHPGYCYTWGGSHYKSFDGKVFSFESQCSHTLVADLVDNTFNINLKPGTTHTIINIFAQDKEYILTLSGDGSPILVVGSRRLQIPVQLSGIIVDNEAHFVVFKLTGIGLSLKWDGQDYIGISVTESLWNRTSGLCGALDGRIGNDFTSKDGSSQHQLTSFINSWKVKPLGVDQCESTPVEVSACKRYKIHDDEEEHFQLETAATNFCDKLLQDPRFEACRAVVDVRPYYEACRWDYCSCPLSDEQRTHCACQSFAVYVKVCNQHGRTTAIKNWRDDNTCPMKCAGSRMYLPCGPSSQETCRSVTSPALVTSAESCEEGCFCPVGTVLHNQQCVSREQCPCQHNGKTFQPGQKVKKGCNTCSCVGGQWKCTEVNCGARCGAIGDPHYLTFDGKRYNFMGKCSYHLLKGDNYSIEAENVACAGSISEAMSFPPQSSSEYPSCTKTITIRLNDHIIKLKQGREVVVDGQEVSALPFTAAGAYIHTVSSIFLIAELPNGLQIWWDGSSRVYIDAPASFQGKTKGLCGTFNSNQNDDFLTPEGDVEQDVVAFANKWKTHEVCADVLERETPTHPCDINVHNKASAEKQCSKLKGSLFEGCHGLVDPEPYYQDCMYDLCSCHVKVGQCLCPIFSAYAKECSHEGIHIDWRNSIRECGIHCPGGQVYQVCGNTCTRSCYDISRNPECKRQCVEGCNCPEGQTIDANTGECIPIGRCVCQYNGVEYPADYREVRGGTKGLELCTCRNALWDCRPATPEESEEFPKSGSIKAVCSIVGNEEFTPCEPVEPVTCKNMHNPPEFTPAICKPGCKCKKGFVMDSHTKKCIRPVDCPCHHGGKSYGEGETMQEECNTCKCESGKWTCTERICAGICTAWGDSHYKTFDGRIYGFHGSCDYVLVKGSLGFEDVFDVSIQNVPCGSSGISCSKSVTLRVGSPGKQEVVTFTRDKPLPLPINLERITMREAGLFVFAEVSDLGLVLQWDKGTRVYVKIDPKWKDRLKGLCGNYNDNQLDDFQTPSGGLSEVSAKVFGDSWRLQSYCPESNDITDTCLIHPNRKIWSMKKCGVLKTSIFQPCHSEVPLDQYLERCIFDACGCDLGGDCECLCTAIAAYAQECNIHGVSIKWRSQQLCPIQCDEKCSHYSPCVQTCPKKTCDNFRDYDKLNHLCSEDPCVEGCEVTPCQTGKVYNNLTSSECVPISTCPSPVCLEIDGKTYNEGDTIEEDACHKCICSHHKKKCIGEPCTTIPPTQSTITSVPTIITPTPTSYQIEHYKCKQGWTDWMNNNIWKTGSGPDIEPLPTVNQMVNGYKGVCNTTDIIDIECRTIDIHQHYKETGDNVECSLERGLLCEGVCHHDYEIRVLCKCPAWICDVNRPNMEHESDCHRFYHCKDTTEGPELIEETCGTYMMYNPKTQVCDLPENVLLLKPECQVVPCDVSHPNKKHEYDCHKFYHCQDTTHAVELVEKTCGPYMMYNPETQVCDWPAAVIALRPECYVSSTTEVPTPVVSTVSSTITPRAEFTETTWRPICEPGWSSWLNTPRTSTGDYENLYVLEEAGRLSCERSQITDIECKFYKNVTRKARGLKGTKSSRITKLVMVDYTASGDHVTCEPSSGLSCTDAEQNDKVCEDYSIRIFCTCEETTVVTLTPPPPHVTPQVTTPTVIPTPPSPCSYGEVWSNCSIPCSRLCHYFDHQLKEEGFCLSNEDCIPGCVPADGSPQCPDGMLWRDPLKCVKFSDCTCRSHNNQVVKPGAVIWESDCEVCQCIDNQYECDSSVCNKTTITLPTETEATTPIITRTFPTAPYPPGIFTPASTESTEATTPPVTTVESTTVSQSTVILATVTPPPPCDKSFIYLLERLPSVEVSASSSHYPKDELQNVPIQISDSVWKPSHQNKDQYLQVDLGILEPVYGIVVRGNPTQDEYVTSYQVMYSDNGNFYYYITDSDNTPAIFHGPTDHKKPVVQHFFKPVEARYIRWNPLTWHNAIAMKIEVLGCGELLTSTVPPPTSTTLIPSPTYSTTVVPEICTEPMGLENGEMADEQITVSTVNDNNYQSFGSAQARLNGGSAWVTDKSNLNQWIQFNFLEPRNVTAIITQGIQQLDSWVVTYTIKHSHDGKVWNPILDSITGSEQVFLGNFDSASPHKNVFERMLHTQYIRLFPTKWHNRIALRAELLGCFITYPPVTLPTTVTTPSSTVPPECNPCPGYHIDSSVPPQLCQCAEGKFWDGENCLNRPECPCYDGYIPHRVGELYVSEDCLECVCKIGGIPSCKEKICPDCEQGLQRVLTPSCACVCKPCPHGTVLCPTSNICINATSWCDGLEDCPDDEVDCTTPFVPETVKTTVTFSVPTVPATLSTTEAFTTTEVITSPTPTIKVTPTPPTCPEVICPPGFELVLKKPYEEMLQALKAPKPHKQRFKGTKSGRMRETDVKGPIKIPLPKPENYTLGLQCEEYICVTQNCTIRVCPPGYKIRIIRSNMPGECDTVICEHPPPIPPAICSVTGRTFNTFDGTEFKYDLCNHILARDLKNDNWDISVYKKCPEVNVPCTHHILIIQDDFEIQLHPDMTVTFNGFRYTIEQLQTVSSELRNVFTLSYMASTLLFKSRRYDFHVLWNTEDTIKISVPGVYSEHVDGLCGFFNQKMVDDKMKPNGEIARTTDEFGDSWVNPLIPAECRPTVCPRHVQQEAHKMCSLVRGELFEPCKALLNVEEYVSSCTETACSCLEAANSTEDGCRCQALLGFVTQCLAADSTVDLSSWRIQYDCPASCPPPLVYHDCYQRECEPTCNTLKEGNVCQAMPGNCIPGCFCPDGLVHKGDKCVKPAECRDCLCNGYGDPQYLTFDQTNYTFNGNCTYVASRDTNPHGKHTFQVLVTNVQCHHKPFSTCTEAVLIEYNGHTIHLLHKGRDNIPQVASYLDKNLVNSYPLYNEWLQIERKGDKEVTVLIPEIQLEVTYVFHDYAFSIRLPSHTFGHMTEGLCGNCNGDIRDDLKIRNGSIIDDTDEFGKNWLHPLHGEEDCTVFPNVSCIPLPPQEDPCLQVVDDDRFIKCHPLVDPFVFVQACQYDICHSDDKPKSLCRDFESYARNCLEKGVCLDWRENTSCPFDCPKGLVYHPCNLGCQLTCDNYKKLKEDPSSCSLGLMEGCFCPDNQVLIDGVCKDLKYCFTCDVEGHIPGQIWSPDNCTTCTCSEDGKVACVKIECPSVDTVCEQGFSPEQIPGTEEECCPKYICIPISTPLPPCPEVIMPVCRKDQQVEKITDDLGCPKLVCIPRKDVCIYEHQYIADAIGGERPRNEDEKLLTIEKPGSTWKDGPCHTCTCEGNVPGEYRPVCIVESCNDLMYQKDAIDYVLEKIPVPNQCCPSVTRTACKEGDSVYKVGTSWPSPSGNPCEAYICEAVGGTVQKIRKQQECDEECEFGFEYVKPPADKCCGQCRQIGCIVDGEVKEANTQWRSPDFCTTSYCFLVNGSFVVQSTVEKCPLPPPELVSDYVIVEEPVLNECCKTIVPVACKVGDKVYKEGESWPSPDGDPCKTVTCIKSSSGQITKEETKQTCNTECAVGWEYIASLPGSNQCCGKCEQKACIEGDKLYEPGAEWSTPDNCTHFECLRDTLSIRTSTVHCPPLNCSVDKQYADGCCMRCQLEPGPQTSFCEPKDQLDTVGIIVAVRRPHGRCINREAIDGFKECDGKCKSKTVYNSLTGIHESLCDCCTPKPDRLRQVSVQLTCEDESLVTVSIPVPQECSCTPCAASTNKEGTTEPEFFMKESEE